MASFYWREHREAQERNCHSLGPSVALIVAPRAGRACEPSPIPILIMSLAVAPPRAPSIDPALRAFLVECLDTADGREDGDGDDVARQPCAFAGLDLPRALSFDEADVDLSGICAWLEGDVVATDGSFLASKTTLASPASKRRARDLGSLDDPRLGDKRGRRGAPATPPRHDDDVLFASLSDPLGGDRTDPDPSNGRDNSNSDNSNSDDSNSDDSNSGPKEARLRRNRASAALSRQRKRTELVHLRQRCRELERANRHFQYVAQCASHENAALRRRLAEIGGVAGGAPVPMSADVAVVPVTHLPIPRMRAQIKTCEAGLGRDLQRTRTAEGTSAGVTTSGVDDATYTLCDMPRVESRRRRGAAWRSNHGTERKHGTERSVCRPRRVRRVRRRFVKTRDEAARDLRDSSPGCAAPRRVTRAVELPAAPSTGRDTRHPSSHRTLSAVLSGLTLAVPYV